MEQESRERLEWIKLEIDALRGDVKALIRYLNEQASAVKKAESERPAIHSTEAYHYKKWEELGR